MADHGFNQEKEKNELEKRLEEVGKEEKSKKKDSIISSLEHSESLNVGEVHGDSAFELLMQSMNAGNAFTMTTIGFNGLRDSYENEVKEKDEKKAEAKNNVFIHNAELSKYGRIHELMMDSTITEVMINAYDEVWIEKRGQGLILTDIKYIDDDEVMDLAIKIATSVGQKINKNNPLISAFLPDGSAVQIIIPPITIKGTTISIQKSNSN